ncbi:MULTISPECIES: hypothetical protein [Aequorivita]|uniref:Uncharacterized protein n=2 Tax=Aequorivita TaxID=153265 RepID=A0AB35YW80_9FLAO|nr:hypothetical protein [Aequorivita sp. Ant34-E75]WGF94011.1 hypothetical protein QCQ61_07415 [Aequorivita sp. Ant34-E75]
MKNVILALAFMLTGTFAFATENVNPLNEHSKIVDLMQALTATYNLDITNAEITCYILHVVIRPDGSQMGSFTLEAPDGHPDCNGIVYHYM